ncbi:MAG: TetR/AcrR family transcriptional regulator C-terminal domain-containing protein, partial [bacterium]
QQLKNLFQYFINQNESDPQPFVALTEFWSMAQKDPDFRKKLQKVYTHFLELIEEIIERGVQSGEFKKVNGRITALSIMVNIESINWFTIFEAHGVSVTEYMETITDFILSGLLKKT